MDETPTCIVCGCAVSEAAPTCPLCGAELAPTTTRTDSMVPRRGAHAATSTRVMGGDSRRKRVIVAGVAVLAVVALAFILHAWLDDKSLHDQARQADSSASSNEIDTVQVANGTGIGSGNVAAGGIVTVLDGVLYEASTDGIFYRPADDAGDGTARRLVSETAFDVNAVAPSGRICFLAASADSRARFEGRAIKCVDGAAGDSPGVRSASTLYEPEAPDALLSSLTIASGNAYFLERTGRNYAVKSFDLEQPDVDELLATTTAEMAWLFVERDCMYLVESDASSWRAKSAALDSNGAFTEVARGQGALAVAAVANGKLYFATDSDDEVHLQRSDLKGGVAEYGDVPNPVRVAASGDVVAAMTKDGHLVWVDGATGVVRDVTARLNGLMPNLIATSAALAVSGDWICVADGKDGFCRISVRDDASVATV